MKKDIIKAISDAQSVFDRLAMEIGLEYSRYKLTDDKNLIESINEKVIALQKVESLLRELEKDLIVDKE